MSGQGEFAIIAEHFSRGYPKPDLLELGIGDDASILNLANCKLVQSLDTQVAGVHFLAKAPASLIAQRALRCAVSDLAAMGAKPLSFHLSLSLPKHNCTPAWLTDFSDGLKKAAHQLNIGLIGGDTTSSNELVIAILVQGVLAQSQAPLTRANAQVGDDVWLSGKVGLAHAALKQELIGVDEQNLNPKVSAYYRPDVHLAFASELINIANACIDVSDGLVQDAQHIAHCSQVSLELDGAKLSQWLALDNTTFWPALTGGDDYQLLFSASPNKRDAIESLKSFCPDVMRIGRVIERAKEPVYVMDSLGERPGHVGYQHF